MPRLVEDAGPALCAGWLSRLTRATSLTCDTQRIGDREVIWELDPPDAVTVIHLPVDPTGNPIRYTIGLIYTDLPSGGLRWWWSCPACHARVDALFLPTDRDRLACRRCCGLLYRSQYTPGKVRRRKRRPAIALVKERLEWTLATGTVLLSRRVIRR